MSDEEDIDAQIDVMSRLLDAVDDYVVSLYSAMFDEPAIPREDITKHAIGQAFVLGLFAVREAPEWAVGAIQAATAVSRSSELYLQAMRLNVESLTRLVPLSQEVER